MKENKEDLTFPQYRKYKNDQSYFKILSLSKFEEIKKMPDGKRALFLFEAKILPDRNFIQDMLYDYREFWDVIESHEYDHLRPPDAVI